MPQINVNAFLLQLTEELKKNFTESLYGIYQIGSLSHGGYQIHYSDIDLALIFNSTENIENPNIFKEIAQKIDPVFGAKVSFFWTDSDFKTGRFPLLDQIDFLDHRKTLFEKMSFTPPRPTLEDVRKYLNEHPMEYWKEKTEFFLTQNELNSKDYKEFLRCILYPARWIYTYTTGLMASNDGAVEFLSNHPLKNEFPLVQKALQIRNSGSTPEDLWPERHKQLNNQVAIIENF